MASISFVTHSKWVQSVLDTSERVSCRTDSVSNLDNDAYIDDMVSGNKEFVYIRTIDTVIMSMAKSGTSTLFYWLYRGITGRGWSPECNTYVQDVRSPCWGSHATAIYELSPKERKRVLTSNQTLRIAIQRNPYERIISAFKSKFTCEHARFGTDLDAQPRIVDVLRRRAGLPANQSRGCMSITEFAHALDLCRIRMNNLRNLDVHIRPQQFYFDDIYYHLVLDVSHLSNTTLLTPLTARLPFAHLVGDRIPKKHASNADELVIPETAVVQLHNFASQSVVGGLRYTLN